MSKIINYNFIKNHLIKFNTLKINTFFIIYIEI